MRSNAVWLLLCCSLAILFPLNVSALDGQCSSVNGSFIAGVPTDNSTLCVGYVPNVVKVTGPDVTWTCRNFNGSGNFTNCMAYLALKLPGTCGKARHQTFFDQILLKNNNAEGNICLYGAPSVVVLVDNQFQWSCYGTMGGQIVNCTAIYAPFSCSGHSEGDTWTQQISQSDPPTKYCTYGAGNLSVIINSTVTLTCSGGAATVKSVRVDNTQRTGACALPPSLPSVNVWGNWDRDPTLGGFAFVQKVRNDSLFNFPSVRSPHGQAVARVQVGLGDDPINSSGERSEIAVPLAYNASAGRMTSFYETVQSGVVYYGITYLFPSGFGGKNYNGNWSIVWQLHGPDTYGLSPSVALAAGYIQPGGRLGFVIEGTGGYLPNGTRGSNPAYVFSQADTEPMLLDRWVEFIIRIKFSISATEGLATVYRRNEGEKAFRLAANVTGATLQSIQGMPVGNHYWKQGLYRQKGDARTDVLYMGPFIRGASFSDVEQAAFGTNFGTTTVPPESDPFSAPGSTTTTQGGSTTNANNSANSVSAINLMFILFVFICMF